MPSRRIADTADRITQMAPRRCLVTGATGFIGSTLVERLVALGHDVRILCRETSNRRWLKAVEGKIEIAGGELTNYESLLDAVTGREWVFHAGGTVRERRLSRYLAINAEGTANLFRAVKHRSAYTLERFVLISSQAAAGPAHDRDHPVTEEMPPAPVSPYGVSKLEAERRLRELADANGRQWPIVILRPGGVYGPRDTDIYQFFKMVRQGLTRLLGIRPHIGLRPAYPSLVHARDLVEACLHAAVAETAVGETFFIANPGSADFASLMRVLQRAIGKKLVLPVVVPAPLFRLLGRIEDGIGALIGKPLPVSYEKASELSHRFWLCDPGKAERLMGWTARIPVAEGFRETYEWYREQGWLV